MDDLTSWSLERGAIYRNVLAKRIDEKPAKGHANLGIARIVDDCLVFGSIEQKIRAMEDGIFLLKIPIHFDLDACDNFSNNFYKGASISPYGQYREVIATRFNDSLLGFHKRTNQIEQFLLERRFWAQDYPTEIARAGEALTEIAAQVLRSILRLTDIPEMDWSTATGGCSDAQGSYHLTFNHYRPNYHGIGLASHKDDGFMTILRVTSPGLEVNRKNQWETVSPDPTCFVVNFGLSMEVLTLNSAQPIRAIMHRVQHQTTDRSSFGHFTSSFCAPGIDAGIYSYSSGCGLRRVCESRDLIDANDEEIYLGTHFPE